jgi:hypothetical protein
MPNEPEGLGHTGLGEPPPEVKEDPKPAEPAKEEADAAPAPSSTEPKPEEDHQSA